MHVSQLQAMEGTPVDVPVPRKVSFIFVNRKSGIVNRKTNREAGAYLLFTIYDSLFTALR
jgi:hypothetical protein